MQQREAVLRRDFGMGMARFLHSREIWLALDEQHYDGGRLYGTRLPLMDSVTLGELGLYHRQLFYWLLIRCGPCIFPVRADLWDGVPCREHLQN